MQYETPRYRPAGERHLLVELGDTADLATNFQAIALAQMFAQAESLGRRGIRAIIDTIPSFTTVLIQYNPEVLTLQGLKEFCQYCLNQLANHSDQTIASRLIEIPVHYNDRWCRECFEQYCQTIKPIADNLELICQLNQFGSIAELIARHSSLEWWVGAVGFVAGLPTLMPLDSASCFQAPKYDPPRTWTPRGTIGVAGNLTTIYPIVMPDGYQMIGRTPVQLFAPQLRRPPFDAGPLLFRVGDRVKFRPISEVEFIEIEAAVAANRYEFTITSPKNISLTTPPTNLALTA